MKNKAPRLTLYCDFCHKPKRVRMGNPDKCVTCECGCETFNYNKDGTNTSKLGGRPRKKGEGK